MLWAYLKARPPKHLSEKWLLHLSERMVERAEEFLARRRSMAVVDYVPMSFASARTAQRWALHWVSLDVLYEAYGMEAWALALQRPKWWRAM